MYKVKVNDFLLYDDNASALPLVDPMLCLAVNEVSSFEFTIYPEHPYYFNIETMFCDIRVYQNDLLVFRGRPISIVYGDFYEKKVKCEGNLAFLFDTLQDPYDIYNKPSDILKLLINKHNQQTPITEPVDVNLPRHYRIGNIRLDNDSSIAITDSDYEVIFDVIYDKLIKKVGGYLYVRYDSDENAYIDYVSGFLNVSPQKIMFGKNLTGFKRTISGSGYFNCILPFGQDGLTIESVNAGNKYLENTTEIENRGKFTKMMEWGHITRADSLKTRAQEYLDDAIRLRDTYEITAVNIGDEPFIIGESVKVESPPHKINGHFAITKLVVNLLNPASNKMTLVLETTIGA